MVTLIALLLTTTHPMAKFVDSKLNELTCYKNNANEDDGFSTVKEARIERCRPGEECRIICKSLEQPKKTFFSTWEQPKNGVSVYDSVIDVRFDAKGNVIGVDGRVLSDTTEEVIKALGKPKIIQKSDEKYLDWETKKMVSRITLQTCDRFKEDQFGRTKECEIQSNPKYMQFYYFVRH